MNGTHDWLADLERGRPASPEAIEALLAVAAWLPAEYLECLRWSDGVEGYVGGRGYLRLWSAREALSLNEAYHVPEFMPRVFLFGTDAAALGYLFDQRHSGRVQSVELAALDDEYVSEEASGFGAFIQHLAEDGPKPEGLATNLPPDWLRGHVLHEKHPIVLGGRPDDPDNRVLVPQATHPELAVFFARTLRSVRAQTLGNR
jgi:hypothetical protein